MTIEFTPVGNTCSMSCAYCYLDPQRNAGNFGARVPDLEKAKVSLAAEGGHFTLHGGDPFQMRIDQLEEIWKWGYERYGQNAAQTHGASLTDEHIALAKKYNAHVGVSVDGPGSMNDLRWMGTLEKTRAATERTHANIRKLLEAGVSCSVILVLHSLNIDPARRDEFKEWIAEMDRIGVGGVRFHPMEVDNAEVAEAYQPSIAEYVEFYGDMHRYMKGLPRLRIDILQDMRALLTGQDQQTTCTWNACDVATTSAVRGVDGEGTRTNCGRTNKDGVSRPKADTPGYERYIALYHTPQEHGGCQGCRFFAMCSGQCPGEAIDGDFRNRSEYCGLYFSLFEQVEAELEAAGVTALSRSPERERIERTMVQGWRRGRRLQIHQILSGATAETDRHGDAPHGDAPHLDSGHGDVPHGDGHGDSNDPAWVAANPNWRGAR